MHPIGCALSAARIRPKLRFSPPFDFGARDQLHHGPEPVTGDQEQPVLRIECRPAPRHPADIPGHTRRPLQTGRRKHSLFAQGPDFFATKFQVGFACPPSVVDGHALRNERDGAVGKGCVAEACSPRHRSSGLPALPPQSRGLPVYAVHSRNKWPSFDATSDRRNMNLSVLPALGEEGGLGGDVVIPKIVMNVWKYQDALPGVGRRSATREFAKRLFPRRAVRIVGARAAGRDEIQDFDPDRRDDGPGVRRPGLDPRSRRNGIPGPSQRTGSGVECPNFTAGCFRDYCRRLQSPQSPDCRSPPAAMSS